MKSGNQLVPRRRLRICPKYGPGSQHLAGQGRGLHRRLRHANHRPRPALHWNEFGGQVGGPIVKNKLFFFADEETSLYNQPSTGNQNSLVPNSNYYTATTGKVSGQVYDLGYACTGNGGTFNSKGICQGKGSQLYMPAAGVAASARQPIPYNQIPVSAIDPVAKALVALPAFQEQVSTLNYFSSGYTHNFQGDMKIDWQASDQDHVMGRYTQMYTHLVSANGTDVLTPNLERQYPLKNIVVDYVRTLSPTLVNDFPCGHNHLPRQRRRLHLGHQRQRGFTNRPDRRARGFCCPASALVTVPWAAATWSKSSTTPPTRSTTP